MIGGVCVWAVLCQCSWAEQKEDLIGAISFAYNSPLVLADIIQYCQKVSPETAQIGQTTQQKWMEKNEGYAKAAEWFLHQLAKKMSEKEKSNQAGQQLIDQTVNTGSKLSSRIIEVNIRAEKDQGMACLSHIKEYQSQDADLIHHPSYGYLVAELLDRHQALLKP